MIHAPKELADFQLGRTTIPKDERGNAHAQEILRLGMVDDVFRMGMNVDKTGRHNETCGIQNLPTTNRILINRNDAPLMNGNIGLNRLPTGAVVDVPIA